MKKLYFLIILCLFLVSDVYAIPPIPPSSSVTDEVGTLTNAKWCTSDGSVVNCTEDAPAGSGDVTSVGDCADGACAAFAIGGIVLGDTSPDANGEIGYASNAYLWFANSEDFKITATENMWTLASNTSAAFTITPALTVTAILTASTSVATPFIALGTDPADAGAVRLPNAGYILSEADAAGTDISVIGVDSSEVVQIGASGASGVTITPATTITGAATLNGGVSAVGTNTVSNAATSAGSIHFKEDSDNGTNTAQLIGPASTADVIITLPPTTGTVALTGTVELTAAPGSDHTASGVVATMTAGENLTIGQICYRKSDGKWWLADADAATTMPGLAMATASISADATGVFLLSGFLRDDSFNWTIGGLVYSGSGSDAHTAGALSQTKPTGSGDQVQIIGYGYTADILYFDPNALMLEL